MSEKPMDTPAASPDQKRADEDRRNSCSPSRRIASCTTTALTALRSSAFSISFALRSGAFSIDFRSMFPGKEHATSHASGKSGEATGRWVETAAVTGFKAGDKRSSAVLPWYAG